MKFDNIQITHFESPHKFWFKIPTFDIKFIEFDISLQNHLKIYDPIGGNILNDPIDVETNQVVAYFDQKWQRWFRGTIQVKFDAGEIGLFLLDFGFPIVTNLKLVRTIPTEFQIWINENLKCGAINQLLPATAELDVAIFDVQISITDDWSSNAIGIVKKIIAESSNICFTSEFELHGQLFGKLYAIRAKANAKQEISSILVKLQHAVFVENITNKFHNRPVSSMSNVSNNFSRCASPISRAGEIRNDFEIKTNRSLESPKPDKIVPGTGQIEETNSKFDISACNINLDCESSKPDDSPIVDKTADLCKPNDKLVETDKLSGQTVSSAVQISSINNLSINQPASQLTNNARNRKMSNQSENSSFSETKTLLDYSESDIDSCISSSPHLAKIFKKMRIIREREKAALKKKLISSAGDNSINYPAVLEPSADTNNQDKLSIEAYNTEDFQYTQCDNYKPENHNVEIVNDMVGSLCDETSDIGNKIPSKHMQLSNNSPSNGGPPSRDSSYTATSDTFETPKNKNSQINFKPQPYSPMVIDDRSMDSNALNTSPDSFETWRTRSNVIAGPSDTSSIETSTIKSNDSARHSNSADNESSPSYQANKSKISQTTKSPQQKLFTKKLHDTGNKYKKLSDASNSNNFQYDFRGNEITQLNQNKKYTFFEKEQKHIVLVHGHTPINPVESVDQVNFSKNIHHALDKLSYKRLFRIDSYTWPHCLNGTSFVVIGAEKTGKTISYLPALIDLILMEEEDNDIIDGVGPIALIVAPTSEKVLSIYKECQKFNSYLKNKLIISKGHGIPNDSLAMNLLNGVHILISTPGCLDRLFGSSVHLIKPERLKFFVIDDYHLMTDQINLIKSIIRSSCVLNPKTELYEQQIIVTSVYWHNTFTAMLNKTNSSFICIGSYMETAYYAKQDVKLLFMRQEDKLNKLNELLSNKEYRLKHTLIVCREATEVDSIVKHLSDWNLEVIGCSRHLSSEIIIRAINDWNDRNDCSLKIVVCTDDILPELHLNRIKVLIHFSLSSSWSKFQYRYSTFFESMPNLLNNESGETKSIVLIDETNNSELPRFIDFLKIHGVKHINPAIEHVSNEIRNQKEIDKETHQVGLCKYILKSGVCRQQNICQFRHKFCDLDKPVIQLAIKKYIKFTVPHVSSPVHFCVNILGTRDTLNDKWIIFDKEDYKIFNIKFKLHYSVKKNHMQHPSCNKGDLCTINEMEKFYRCRIISFEEKRGVLSDRRVFVKTIDVGKIVKTTESRLLLLPDQFKIIPPKLIDMRIGGVFPIDNEYKWDSESTEFVKKYFTKHEQNPELFLEASLSFIITDTIFVDSIVFKQDLEKYGGGELEIRNYKTDLVKSKIGISDEEGFNCAKELIRAADFEVFELKIQSKIEHLSPDQTPPKQNSIIIPTIASKTPSNENSVIIPTIAEIPLLNDNNQSDSHQSIFNISISEDDNESPTKLSDKSAGTLKSTSPPVKRNTKLGISLPNKIEPINLCCFNSPMNFYIQKMSSLPVINARLFDIQEYLIESDHKKPENCSIGDIYLVLYDGYYDRGEIILMYNDEVYMNICDLGFAIKYNKNDLYEIDETIKNQPFEAIKCQLFGVKPIGVEAVTWDEKCIDEIYDYINDNYTDHYLKKIIEINISDERPAYSVMLFGVNVDKGMEIINKVLVEKGWAEYNEEVRTVFDQACVALVAEFDENVKSVVIHNNNLPEFDEELFCNSLSYEECIEMFNFPEMPSSATINEITEDDLPSVNGSQSIVRHEKILPSATITEITEETVSSPFPNLTDQIISYGNDPPPLESCYNLLPLKTLWHQDATTVTLKINVTDHVDYHIEIHKRLVNVCVHFDDQTSREITLNLFGVVNNQNFMNTIVGNYLKIVLIKSIRMNLLWPRLLLVDRKLSWLRYNYDTFEDFDIKDDYIEYKIKCMDSSSDTGSDEQLDEDDECDPLSSQYNFVENKFFDENNMKMSNNC